MTAKAPASVWPVGRGALAPPPSPAQVLQTRSAAPQARNVDRQAKGGACPSNACHRSRRVHAAEESSRLADARAATPPSPLAERDKDRASLRARRREPTSASIRPIETATPGSPRHGGRSSPCPRVAWEPERARPPGLRPCTRFAPSL